MAFPPPASPPPKDVDISRNLSPLTATGPNFVKQPEGLVISSFNWAGLGFKPKIFGDKKPDVGKNVTANETSAGKVATLAYGCFLPSSKRSSEPRETL